MRSLRAWWVRTPSLGGYGWAGVFLLGLSLGLATAVPEGFLWGLIPVVVGLLGLNLARIDVTKRQTRIFFKMMAPSFPGAVMIVDANRLGIPCTAPDCADLPPHVEHFGSVRQEGG